MKERQGSQDSQATLNVKENRCLKIKAIRQIEGVDSIRFWARGSPRSSILIEASMLREFRVFQVNILG